MILGYVASPYAQYDHQWPTDFEEIKGVAEWFASGDRFLAVYLKQAGKLIGFVTSNLEESANLGYIFNFDFHGHGYATEACGALVDYGFNVLGVNKFNSGTAAANTPSCRLLERLGFEVIEENTGSFQTTEDGNPIEFNALKLTLTKEKWQSR